VKKSSFIAQWIPLFLFILSLSTYAGKFDHSQAMQLSHVQAQQLLPFCELVSMEPYFDCHEDVIAYSLDYENNAGEAINLLLAADQSRNPIMRYSFQRNPDKQHMDAYIRQAEKFVTEPQHSAAYYFGIGECWHLFCQGSDSIFICTNPAMPPKTAVQFREYKSHLQQYENVRPKQTVDRQDVIDQWRRLQNGTLLQPESWHYIPDRYAIPDFDWHYGCTPTAAANVLAYYEAVYGYGNMISYYFREADAIQGGTDETVANIAFSLADYMGTNANGSTVDAQLGLHIAQAGEAQDPGYSASDYGLNVTTPWARLQSEVDGGYPCVLSCDMPGADIVWHSMTAVGYNDNPEQVAVYNINDKGISFYDWNTLVLPNVAWVHFPLVNRANGVMLTSLKGGIGSKAPSDILQTNQNYEITWTCDRPGDGKVDIELNKNGGVGSWETLASLNSNPGQWVWLPGEEHVGEHNRIRIVWKALDGSRFGYDASYSDFTVTSADLYDLPNSASIHTSWPEALKCGYAGNQWVVMAVYQTDIMKNNTLRIYPDTTFQTKAAEDKVGKDHGTKWGLCGVNVGPSNPPPGPFGVQIVGEGEGYIQFMESEELQWGTNGNYVHWSQNQIVKAYHFYVDARDKILLNDTKLYLENFISDDLSMYLFDMNKRFFSADDALLIADNAISGSDEQMTLPTGASGRFLLVIRNKSNSQGYYRISLTNEAKAMQVSEILWDTPDTLAYSGAIMTLPLDQAPWSMAGVLPLGEAQWELSVAQDCTFTHPIIASRWPKPYTNMILMKKNNNPDARFYLKASRASKKGSAHIEMNRLADESPLRDGQNPPRDWPAGKAFHLLPIVSAHPLIEAIVQVEASDGRKIYCGIAPDKGEKFVSTSMLWGSANGMPMNGDREVKTGVVVLWTLKAPTESFTFTFRTRLYTDIEEPVVPDKYDLTVYPNPFTDKISISGIEPGIKTSEILIYDVLGRRQRVPMQGNSGMHIIIDTQDFPTGLYFVRVGSQSNHFFKVVKIK